MWYALLAVILIPVTAAWIQFLVWGLPVDPSAHFPPLTSKNALGFPAWLRITHWANFVFITLIIRSGLSILWDHPRLYFNDSCTPLTDWLRFTPKRNPEDKKWTSNDDARYISPALGLPGYRHSIGIARVWHFLNVPLFILNGVVFIIFLSITNFWRRLIPTSWHIIPAAWSVFVHYVTFQFPIEPDPFFHFNALQFLVYFVVVFVMAPLAILTGLAMSPAIANRFHWYPKLFGNRQTARSIHFGIMVFYVIFIIVHVALVVATGVVKNLNNMVMGTNDPFSFTGLYIAIGIILFVTLICFIALWLSWHRRRFLQKTQAFINENLWISSLNLFKIRKSYKKEDISPYFWANGKIPDDSEEWKELAKNDFKDYKLQVKGLCENPLELSINEMKDIVKEQNITMHNCIQGWSGIAEWGGIPMSKIIELAKPESSVSTVAFYSYGSGLIGGPYYDTHTLENCKNPMCILAWEMNYEPLPIDHGAPLRLRMENQLGYKMVKWIDYIEFIESYKDVGKGYGGKHPDEEYYDLLANT
jgi:DMSO/TMAO reductase YedYZ molybdopterin-dependent catalytic subunit/thiosulfate reductase cytochrome b subunit